MTKGKRRSEVLFVAPAIGFLLIVVGYPLAFSLYLSFVSWNSLIPRKLVFVGLDNFRILLDPAFLGNLKNTLFFVFGSLGLKFPVGFGLALILNKHYIKGKSLFLTLLMLPIAASPVVTGLTWKYFYEPSAGTFNAFLGLFGLPTPQWLAAPKLAMVSLIIADAWQWTPLAIMLLLAGLQTLPRDPQEAAQIDGASSWKIVVYIVLPLLSRTIFLTFLFLTIISFKVFDIVFLTTAGGPGQSTEVLSLSVYKTGLFFFRISSGAALSQILLIISILFCMFFIKRLPLKE